MERWYNVKETAEVMRCGVDTARARMEQMPDVINVGTKGRRILMVPESNIEDWFRNHRMATVKQILPKRKNVPKVKAGSSGKLARMDRRTGKLVAV